MRGLLLLPLVVLLACSMSGPTVPEADRRSLLRRVTFDLTGLPPTLAQVKRFEELSASDIPAVYEELVDELLDSSHFGEQWARHWLDLARYADSHGFQRDNFRDNWAYRDWVIRALNEDMPFDQFTIEQLAGDLLPEATARDTSTRWARPPGGTRGRCA